jgi:hypothetical protein
VTYVFFSYWWLIFPVMWFAFGLSRSLFRYGRQRDAMDVARAYAANGREPPAEITRILSERPC